MKNIILKGWLLAILVISSLTSYTQIMHGGEPFAFRSEERFPTPIYQMPFIDPRIIEERINEEFVEGEKPFEFAYNHEVDLNPDNSGVWEDVKGGRIWRVSVSSQGAYSLNLGFDKFYIPEGAKLFIYNSDKSDFIGALTHKNNKEQRTLSTSLIKGDQVTIEYFEPNNAQFPGEISISRVSHDYVNMIEKADRAFGDSGSCNMNVNCPDGQGQWQTEKRAVAMIIAGGSRACTGTLIANYAQDNTPYFLTANHCWSSQAVTESWVFMFNYESPDCNNTDGPTNQTISNCTFRSRNPDSDFLLVELSSLPPQSYNPYIAGFDKSGNIPAATIGIHHPSGDIKKISFDDDSPGSGNMGTAIANAEWQIYAWDRSTTTEPGSSGSGLWDNNYRLIGQLHGGQATCSNSVNDYYGKISVSWDNGGTSTTQLQNWLDPSNQMTTLNTVDGYDPYAPTASDDAALLSIDSPNGSMCEGSFDPIVTIQNKGTDNLTSCTITYDLDGGSSQTYNWTGNLATNETAQITLSSMTANAGAHTFNAATSNPNGNTDGNTANDTGSSSFTAITVTAGQALPFTEGFENATFVPTGWTLTNANSNATWSRVTTASGNGASTACAKMDFFSQAEDISGQSDYLDLPVLDFSAVSSPAAMDFNVAYARYGAGNDDSLIVHVSTDCGATYTRVYFDGGTTLATVADQTAEWTATASDWAAKSIDLSAYAGQSNIQIRIEAKSNWGNNLYLDDINIYGTNAVAAEFSASPTSGCPGTSVTFTDESTGSITGWSWTFTGGTPSSSTDQNPVVVYNTPGTYDVTLVVTDGSNNDTETKTTYITINDTPSGSASTTDALCNGSSDGTATVNASGGSAPYTYLWDDASTQTTATATGLAAGSYNVTITDANGCNGSASATVSEPNTLTGSTTANDASCGNNDGDASVTPTGGTSPYTYLWDDPSAQTTATATNLAAATYTVTITDANECTTNVTASVSDQSGPSVSTSGTDASCNGVSDGTATATVTGGTSPYTYLWDDAGTQTTATATGLASGVYNVIVTDNNGCTTSAPITLQDLTGPSATISSSNNVSCNGGNDGDATVDVTGGTSPYSYAWNDASTQTTVTASDLTAGSYDVIATDVNGCTSNASITITEPNAISVSVSSTDVSTNGGNDGTATATVTGGTPGYTYQWDDASIQTTATAAGLSAGVYNVIVTDANGCTVTQVVSVIEPTSLDLTTSSTDVTCNSGTNGSATVSVSGGVSPYTYLWDDASTQTSATASGLVAGTYNVTVTDDNGAVNTASVTILEPTAVNVTISESHVSCNGGNDGSAPATATGGNAPYTYLWDDASTQSSATASNLVAGMYSVIVTDINGCSGNQSITITEPTAITTSTSSNNSDCGASNGDATVTVTGGTSPYTYLWDDASSQTTSTATNLSSGTYNVVITDNNGCSANASVTVNSNGMTATATSTDPACFGDSNGTATASSSGGSAPFTYLWDDDATQTTQTATNLTAGVYSVTVTDAGGCVASTSVTLSEPTQLSASITSNYASCGNNDGDATVTAAGGTTPYTYLWDDLSSQTTAMATSLGESTYNVVVTDANSCTVNESVTINNNSFTLSVSGNDVTCNGDNDGNATVSISGGTAPFTYAWDDAFAQTEASAINLTAGTYNVIVTDGSACSNSISISINEPNAISLSTNGVDASCGGANGIASVTSTGGTAPYTYIWNDASSQTTAIATNLVAGNYNVVVTDANGCTSNTDVTISNVEPSASATSTDENCSGSNDGSVTVVATGGTAPYTYLWDDSNSSTTATVPGLGSGTYIATVTDANGCTAIATAEVNAGISIDLTTVTTDATCGASDGTATVSVTGGTQPYTYAWNDSGSQATATATGLIAGSYTISVTDANGCSNSANTTVNNTIPNVDITASSDVSCFGANDGNASALASGGSEPYTYQWNDILAQQTATANLAAGTYTVTATDASGCTDQATVTISQPVQMSLATLANNVSCDGSCDGFASVSATGGTSPYTYQWNDPSTSTTQNISNLCFGTYSVTVVDANGCQAATAVSVNKPAVISVSTSYEDVSCNSSCDGVVNAVVTGGSAPYTYSWDDTNSQTTASASNLCEGTYTVLITDVNGCTESTSVTITEPTALSINSTTVADTCGNGTGSAELVVAGGNQPYSYQWNNGNTTNFINNVDGGTYTVNIVDANGCSSNESVTISSIGGNINVQISSNQEICEGSSAAITATGASTYIWGIGQNGSTITVSPVETTTYGVIGIDQYGCESDSAYSTVTVSTAPTTLVSAPTTICNGETITVSASGGNTYNWNTGATTSSIIVSPTSTTMYSVIASNGTCQGSVASTTVTVLPSPSADGVADVDTTYLSTGGTVNFSGTTSGGSDISWEFGDGYFDTQANTTHNYSSIGTYEAVLIVSNGSCDATDTVTIVVEQTNSIDNLLEKLVQVYPNPTSGMINLNIADLQELNIELFNEHGQLIDSKIINGNTTINYLDLSTGIYMMRLTSENHTTTKRIQIIK